jgi:hypothetical protein
MANKRFLRSTINLNASLSSPLVDGYATLSIYINGSSTPLYAATKQGTLNTATGNIEIQDVHFEVGELFSDYLDIEFNGTYTSQSLECDASIIFYLANGAVFSTNSFNFYGVDGFTYFQQGADVIETGTAPAITTRILYVPNNTAGYVPTFSATGFTYNSFSTTATTKTVNGVVWQIKRLCNPKYEPFKVTFVNKYGALEDIYFDLVRRNTTEATYEKFKRNIVNSNGSYSINQHQTKTFNQTGKDSFTLNTDFVDESFNETLEELLLSKKIWITENGQVLPIICKTKSLEKKTSLINKLVQYEFGFEYAFDKINKIR